MKSDRTKRTERWIKALQWAFIGVLWIVITYGTPDLPLLTFDADLVIVYVVTVALMGMTGYSIAWFSQWRETPDAVGPDELDSFDSTDE